MLWPKIQQTYKAIFLIHKSLSEGKQNNTSTWINALWLWFSSTCFHLVDVSQITAADCWMRFLFHSSPDLMVTFYTLHFLFLACQECVSLNVWVYICVRWCAVPCKDREIKFFFPTLWVGSIHINNCYTQPNIYIPYKRVYHLLYRRVANMWSLNNAKRRYCVINKWRIYIRHKDSFVLQAQGQFSEWNILFWDDINDLICACIQ